MIVTSRFGTDLSALRQPWKALAIDAADPRNTADLHRFPLAHGTDEPLAAVLTRQEMSIQEFARRTVDAAAASGSTDHPDRNSRLE